MRILINGFSAVHGGGATVLRDFLEGLSTIASYRRESYVCIAPKPESLTAFNSDKITVCDRRSAPYSHNSLTFNEVGLDRFCKANEINAIINFGDLIPSTNVSQLYFFDWAYLLYPESPVWKSMSRWNWIQRSLKAHMIRRRLHLPSVIVVQCEAMKQRMQRLSDRDVITIPSPCRFTDTGFLRANGSDAVGRIARVLVLSGYAPHKNFLLVKSLARIINNRKVPLKITLTIDTGSSKAASDFLSDVQRDGLSHIISNAGRVPHEDVADLVSAHDALLLPTLLESYGLPYIEGMMCGKTIITSDLDFAHSVCGDAAFYFDPFSADSALDAILAASNSPEERTAKIARGFARIQSLPTLEESAIRISNAVISRLV